MLRTPPWNANMSALAYQRSLSSRQVQKPKFRRPENGRELCSYVHRICLQNRLEGFDYCIRHILEDRSAPFRQCSYVHPQSGKRCPNAARRTDRRDSTLCPWHIKKLYLKRKQAQLQQQRLNSEESGKRDNMKKLLRQLEHYCPSSNHDQTRTNLDWVLQEDGSTTASDHLREKITEAAANLNGSDTDDECVNPVIDETLRSDFMDSDSESLDSDHEDPLKHAGVYTAEEVSLVLRDKMLRLQSLYIEQFKHLQYLLKERRKKYLHQLKLEKESSGLPGLHTLQNENNSRDDFKKLSAFWRYHRCHGQDALLRMQAKEKRKAALNGENYKPPVYPTCIFTKGEEVCNNRSLPLSHYCKKRKTVMIF